MCKICGNDRCTGKILLHPKELINVPAIKLIYLVEEGIDTDFLLINSPGNIFTEFKELHILGGQDGTL